MDIMAIILLLLAFFLLIMYLKEKKNNKVIIENKQKKEDLLKEIEINEKKIRELAIQYNELTRTIEEKRVEEGKAQENFNRITQNVQATTTALKKNQEEINLMKKNFRNTVLTMLEQQYAALRQEKEQEIALWENEMKTAADERIAEIFKNIAIAQKDLEEYEAKRRGIIEAQKREKELKEQQNYHRIILKPAAIEDIKCLKDIFEKINHKEILAKLIWSCYIQVPTQEMLNRIIGNEKKSGIYRITNIDTQECYIGQSVDIAHRIVEHIKGTLGIQSIADQRIHHEMADTGVQNWTFEVLETCAKEELNNREKFYINFYKSNEFGYNKTKGNK